MSSSSNNGTKCYRAWRRSGLWCALAVMIPGLYTALARGQCLEEKLTASDARSFHLFGVSVSVSGDTAVVGAARDTDGCAVGLDCGSAYVFRFNGSSWVEEQKLTASDAMAEDHFGNSVSVSGDTAVIGANGDDCAAGFSCGSAYVFRFNGTSWIEEQKLTAYNAAAQAFVGWSVSVSGDTIVVGALWDECATSPFCGSAYIYRFDGTSWIQEQKLTASDATAGDRFGASVSVSGDTAVVGAAEKYCAAGGSCGTAYVFQFNGTSWDQQQKLTASDAVARDRFGISVSVKGNTALVGALGDDCAGGSGCGAAYVYRFNGNSWVEEQRLIASDATARDQYGSSVSLSTNTAVVGAWWDGCSVDQGRCGSAYVYRFNGTSWVEKQKLTASDGAASDTFGQSVSVSGDMIVVGAGGVNCTPGVNCGAAYMYSCASAPEVVNLDIKPGSCPNMVNPKSRGVVPVAIIGNLDFDVAAIDPDSLTLARADGVGTSVSPLSGRRGRGIVLREVATPFVGEPCTCHEVDRDGIDDLAMKFSTSDMSRAFELNGLPRGTTVELVLQGTLQDGTTFEGVDCIVIPGTERSSIRRYHIRRPK